MKGVEDPKKITEEVKLGEIQIMKMFRKPGALLLCLHRYKA